MCDVPKQQHYRTLRFTVLALELAKLSKNVANHVRHCRQSCCVIEDVRAVSTRVLLVVLSRADPVIWALGPRALAASWRRRRR